MSRFQWILISLILAVGLLAGGILLSLDSITPVQSAEEHEEGSEAAEKGPEGPHEGVLLGEARQAALVAAQAEATPDLATSGGLRYHPPGDWGVVASVTLPLPMYNQNQGSIEAARLRQGSLAAEREQDLAQLNSELRRAQERYLGASHRLALYRTQLQLAREAFRIAVIVFDTGKSSYLEVLQSQQSYFEARHSLIETQWELEQAMIALRTLTHDLDPIEDIPVTAGDPE